MWFEQEFVNISTLPLEVLWEHQTLPTQQRFKRQAAIQLAHLGQKYRLGQQPVDWANT
jgi:hypothetical protein